MTGTRPNLTRTTLAWNLALTLSLAACDSGAGAMDAAVDGASADAPAASIDAQATVEQGCTATGALGAVLVVRDASGTRHVGLCGHADRARTRPVARRDRFRVGSVTKTFTSALVLSLVDDGAVSLDDTVASFGLVTDHADTITVRHLLSHTACLVEYNDAAASGFDWSRSWTIDEVVDWVTTQHEPLCDAGAEFHYSGTHFQVLAQIVRAEGRPAYPIALRQTLLDPLGLADTYLDGAETLPGGRVEGARRVGATIQAPEFSSDWASADGSLATTADDLVSWLEHLFIDRDVLSDATLAAMTTPTQLTDGTTPVFLDAHYGMGLEIEDAPDGTIYSHGGGDFGFAAYAGIQPSTGRAVAVVINTEVDPRIFAALAWSLFAAP